MKKNLKKFTFTAITILLVFTMGVPLLAFLDTENTIHELEEGLNFETEEVTINNEYDDINIFVADDAVSDITRFELLNAYAYSNTRATLTSAIDDSPFLGFFDHDTGIASFFNMDGEPIAIRDVGSEEGFWELVRINTEITSQHNERQLIDRTNRNASIIDVASRTLIEYNEHGRVTETYLSEEFATMLPDSSVFAQQENVITPFFNPVHVSMFVPQAQMPTPAHGRSVFVGGGFFRTTQANTRVFLRTHGFPAGMQTIDAYFTNSIGDCNRTVLDILPNQEAFHNLRFPGEQYGVRVSSFYGSFNNVTLRFFTGGTGGTVHTITSPSQDNLNFNRNNLNISWAMVPGATYRLTLRNLTANRLVLSDVPVHGTSFTIDRRFFYEGHSYRVAVSANVGGNVSWSERTFNISLGSDRQTILNRARNMNNFTWTINRTLTAWGGRNNFLAGTHRGIPYSQTPNQVSSTTSVPWVGNRYLNTSLSLPDFFTISTNNQYGTIRIIPF